MKKWTLGLLFFLFTSFNLRFTPKDFHLRVESKEKVEEFANKFPQIVSNEAVYVAYLQKYKYNEDFYLLLTN